MTNRNERPKSLLSDMTWESRGIQKIAEQVQYAIDDMIRDQIIDPDYPDHLEDEELDAYRDEREMKLIKMVAQCLLGRDMIK